MHPKELESLKWHLGFPDESSWDVWEPREYRQDDLEWLHQSGTRYRDVLGRDREYHLEQYIRSHWAVGATPASERHILVKFEEWTYYAPDPSKREDRRPLQEPLFRGKRVLPYGDSVPPPGGNATVVVVELRATFLGQEHWVRHVLELGDTRSGYDVENSDYSIQYDPDARKLGILGEIRTGAFGTCYLPSQSALAALRSIGSLFLASCPAKRGGSIKDRILSEFMECLKACGFKPEPLPDPEWV